MKAYICDRCEKREEPQKGFDLPKDGWFSLTLYGKYATLHFCSASCLQMHAAAIVLSEVEAQLKQLPDEPLAEMPTPADAEAQLEPAPEVL